MESGIQLKRYNPNFTNKDRNQVHGIRNLGRGIQNQRLSFTWGKSSLSVFSNTVRKKKKERKKTLSIDAVVVVFFFASKVSCSESFEREQ